jgi:A/G-specific adenine glycosylase
MLLRKTRAAAVAKVYPDFISRFGSFYDLASANEESIATVIYSLGMHSRAKSLRKVAQQVCNNYQGNLPSSREELLELIGPSSLYTVNAIQCFGFGRNLPIFDVNVARILSRVFSIDFGTEPHKNPASWQVASLLLPASSVKQYNWALLDLGREVCIRKPRCNECPILSICDYGQALKQGSGR